MPKQLSELSEQPGPAHRFASFPFNSFPAPLQLAVRVRYVMPRSHPEKTRNRIADAARKLPLRHCRPTTVTAKTNIPFVTIRNRQRAVYVLFQTFLRENNIPVRLQEQIIDRK